jgi:phosphomannomutase
MEEIKIKTESGEKEKIIDNLSKILKDENADILDIDGLRVNRKNGWWLIRASQTSDAITIKCEGLDATGREKMIAELDIYLKKASDGKISMP